MFANLFSDYNFVSFFKRMKKSLIWMLIAAIVCSAAGYLYAVGNFVETYTAYTTIYISRLGDDKGQFDSSEEFNSSRFLATTCVVVLKENAVAERAFDVMENKGHHTPAQIKNSTTITQVEESQIIKISCTSTDPQFAYDVCHAYEKIVPTLLQSVLNGGTCQIITEATMPRTANVPDYIKWALYGMIAGVLLVIIITILMFVFDRTIKSSEEIKERFELPIWAEIPSLGKSKRRKNGQADIEDSKKKLLNPQSPFLVVESYKTARTNMAFLAGTDEDGSKRGHSLILTSAEQNAGKSLTTANLAMTMAKKDAKVLIVDADMRKPIQHKLFDIDNEKGLSLVLAGTCSPTECIFKLEDNLHIMPAGKIPPNPSELLDKKKMAKLIDAMCSVYDYVFFDTPPVVMVTDACVLAPKTDGVILVARESKTTGSMIEKALDALKKAEADVRGVILTDVREYSKTYNYRKNRYKYRYRNSYYSYEYVDEQTKNEGKSKKKSRK